MTEAAVLGVLDFKTADQTDPKWQRKRDWIIAYLDQKHAATLRGWQLIQLCAAGARDESAAKRAYQQLCDEAVPWARSKPPHEVMADMTKEYEAQFGKLDDPATQAEIQRLLEHWNA
jgi:hypothetical protein